jgi:CRP-like cAMP-binding protein
VTLDVDVARLARTRPFSLLPREAVQLVAFSCRKRRLRPGELLFRAGDTGDEGYFLHSGMVVLARNGAPPGEERRVIAGALIGESALYAPVVRQVEARVVEDAVVTPVPRETFRRVLSEFPAAADKLRGALAVRAKTLVEGLDAARVRSLDTVGRKPETAR